MQSLIQELFREVLEVWEFLHVKMFNYCKSLNKLDIYNFYANNNIDMHYIIYNWNDLKYLNMSNFNVNNS